VTDRSTDWVVFASSAASPHERGVELGAAHAPEVAAAVTAYQRFWRWLDPEVDLAFWGARALDSIHEQAPRAADEIAGIAAGSGRTVEEIAALNARTEVLAGIAPRVDASECSTVVSAAPGRPPIAVQTWDWYPQMRDGWFVWSFETAGGRRVTTLTEYGVLAKIGVNDAGLGVMLNMLHHAADDQLSLGTDARIGFPVHVMLRTLLEECGTVDEARDLVRSKTFTASSALTVVDRGGDAASLEAFPEGVGEVKPEAGLLVRTNHFVSAEGEPGCLAGLVDDNSWVRRDHLVASLRDPAPASADDVHAAMRHHVAAGPVCRHAVEPDSPDYLEASTLATVTLDVEHGELSVLRGGPCQEARA
jgi:isopenicillin-N N-acyltransferase-like protein